MIRIAIVGLPNTGKSQVYNELTRDYNIVANYPLTTIELKRKQVTIRDNEYEIIDTPGLHSLFIHSEEELVVRDFLFDEKPDGVIQCIDINRIRQSLRLTLDLFAMGIPMAICLNSVDDTNPELKTIRISKLAARLGVPVVDHSLHMSGPVKVKGVLDQLRPGTFEMSFGEEIDAPVRRILNLIPDEYSRETALLLFEGDEFLLQRLTSGGEDSIEEPLAQLRNQYRGNINADLRRRRNLAENAILSGAVAELASKPGNFAGKFAAACRHPVWGFAIFCAIAVLVYLLVVEGAGAVEGFLSSRLVDPVIELVDNAVRAPFWNNLLIGHYGVLTLGLFNAFVTVLPILTAFFLVLGLLEDIGYLPNLSVLTRRILGKIGLTGKSVMSLVLGFGCKTMATLTTRGIRSKKERLIAIYLIAFAIPCSAQLAIDMAILGKMGVRAFIIAFATLAIVEIGAGFILNKLLPSEESEEFIQELSPIRRPDPKAILKKTGYRLYWFLKEAVPIFIIASVVLFLVDWIGVLDAMKRVLQPVVVGWLGLPLDIVEVLILSLARHEAAAGLLLKMVERGGLTYVQSIVAVVITTMFVPCFANIVAMCRQAGLARGLVMTFTINISAFILAGVLNWILISVGL